MYSIKEARNVKAMKLIIAAKVTITLFFGATGIAEKEGVFITFVSSRAFTFDSRFNLSSPSFLPARSLFLKSEPHSLDS